MLLPWGSRGYSAAGTVRLRANPISSLVVRFMMFAFACSIVEGTNGA